MLRDTRRRLSALIPGVALNEVVDLLERAYTYRGTERTRRNHGKYGRVREREAGREGGGGGGDVASACETPKLVSTRGLTTMG